MTTPSIIAHRGASIEHIENGAAAFERARDLRVDWIELDVRRTRDGVVVVHHDDDLQRSAGDPRRIDALSFDALRAIELRYDRVDERARVPSLADALSACEPVPLAIEVKGDDPDVADLTRRAIGHLDPLRASHRRARLLSFELAAVDAALELLPAERVALVRNAEYGDDGWRDGLRTAAGTVVLSRKIATVAMISELRGAGKQVWVYSIDRPDDLRRYASIGVDGVITNDPATAMQTLRP